MEQFNTIFTPPKLNPKWPLGLGALTAMAGAGWVVGMLISADNEMFKTWSIGVIGIFIGFGLILYYYLTRQPEGQ